MHRVISFAFATVVATAVSTAVADSKPLGKRTEGQIMLACLDSGGTWNESGSSFGCKTDKGEVTCKKTGTLNQGSVGMCEGYTKDAQTGGRPRGRTVGSILTGSPKAQPLRPQQVTTSPGRAPTRPLTQQNITGSPKTAPTQPLTKSSSSHPRNR
jgi:hypothetical protein